MSPLSREKARASLRGSLQTPVETHPLFPPSAPPHTHLPAGSGWPHQAEAGGQPQASARWLRSCLSWPGSPPSSRPEPVTVPAFPSARGQDADHVSQTGEKGANAQMGR